MNEELRKIGAFFKTLNDLRINKYQRMETIIIKQYEENLRIEEVGE